MVQRARTRSTIWYKDSCAVNVRYFMQLRLGTLFARHVIYKTVHFMFIRTEHIWGTSLKQNYIILFIDVEVPKIHPWKDYLLFKNLDIKICN